MGGILDGLQMKSGLQVGRYWRVHGPRPRANSHRARSDTPSILFPDAPFSSFYFLPRTFVEETLYQPRQVGSLVRTRNFRKVGSTVFEMRRDKVSHLFVCSSPFERQMFSASCSVRRRARMLVYILKPWASTPMLSEISVARISYCRKQP